MKKHLTKKHQKVVKKIKRNKTNKKRKNSVNKNKNSKGIVRNKFTKQRNHRKRAIKRNARTHKIKKVKHGGRWPFTRRTNTVKFRTRTKPMKLDDVDRGSYALTSDEKENFEDSDMQRQFYSNVCKTAEKRKIFEKQQKMLPAVKPRGCDRADLYFILQQDPTFQPPSVEECQTPGHEIKTKEEKDGGEGYDYFISKDNVDAVCGSGYYKTDKLSDLIQEELNLKKILKHRYNKIRK